ncbi:MAG: PBP1A family penicillin-binding protein [Pseudomonadota bacterium]
MSKRGDGLTRKGQRGSRRAAAERARSESRSGSRSARRKSSPSGGKSKKLKRGGGEKKPLSPFWRWTKRIAIGGTALALLGVIFLAFAVGFAAQSIPGFYELKANQNAQSIVVRARDGKEIVELGPSYGEWLQFNDIPDNMKNAMIAVEDKRYYSHFGVDPIRLTGALIEGITGTRSRLGGTSTITQQLARNIFLNSNRTFDRKAREAVLALALEWKFSKEQILELYLNKVYFGGGAYGVDSASRRFFSHPATELSVAESAIIAGLVKAPSRYSPTADVQAAVDRARVVLRLMREQDYITAAEASVDVDSVQLKEQTGGNSVRYFTDWALPQLDLLLPETFEPIEVWTTLDVGMQNAATASIDANSPAGAQGALVSVDRDGAILAMVGGRDYVKTNYNRATNAVRQPGSSWKLFVYLAALEAQYSPDDDVVDAPVEIQGWSPRNANGRNIGKTTLRTAFAFSINTVAAQLGSEVGFGTVAAMARRFGITTPVSSVPSMVLGTNEVRLIEMTGAVAAIAAGGRESKPYGIKRVTTASGELLYKHEKGRETALVPDYVAAGATDIMEAAVARGTGKAAQIGRPVAGKTGTTSSNKDGYFVGFSSGITTGVWMGRDDNKKVSGLQGGRAPARAFSAYMRYAVKDRPVEQFKTDADRPEWQLEPDEEQLFGDPDDYYFTDEQGNLIEPGLRDPGAIGDLNDGNETPRAEPPPAVNEDFLEDAIGGSIPRDDRRAPPPRRDPPPPVPRSEGND